MAIHYANRRTTTARFAPANCLHFTVTGTVELLLVNISDAREEVYGQEQGVFSITLYTGHVAGAALSFCDGPAYAGGRHDPAGDVRWITSAA